MSMIFLPRSDPSNIRRHIAEEGKQDTAEGLKETQLF
jgi:hypothetical protein